MKKLISYALCVTLLFSFCVVLGAPTASAVQKCTCPNDPIIYIFGRRELFLKNEDGSYVLGDDGKPLDITDRGLNIGDLLVEYAPKLVSAYFTGNWDEYSKEVLEKLLPIYEGIAPDKNGEVHDKYLVGNDDVCRFGDYAGATHGRYMGYNNQFFYDYRESPIKIAADLNAFIEQVKERTGHDKVVICARCLGSNIAQAWLHLYQENIEHPFENVSEICYMSGTFDGTEEEESMFSGNLCLEGDNLYYLANNNQEKAAGLDDETFEWISLILDTLQETYSMDMAAKIIQTAYKNLNDSLIAPFFRAYNGVCGTTLSMIRDRFPEAMDYLFPTQELKDEYAGLIEKATYVHDNITARSTEILKKAQEYGVGVSLIGEYGFLPVAPIYQDCLNCGDAMLSLNRQTLGAVTSRFNGKLSEKYIAQQTELGLGKYLSVDSQVDISPCPFRDRTWVIKNANHIFVEDIHSLAVAIVRDHIDNNSARYPVFMNYDPARPVYSRLVPLQAENYNDVKWTNISSAEDGKAAVTLLQKLIDIFKEFFEMIINFITELANAVIPK